MIGSVIMNITTKQFQLLSDVNLIWDFLVDIHDRELIRRKPSDVPFGRTLDLGCGGKCGIGLGRNGCRSIERRLSRCRNDGKSVLYETMR